MMLLGIDWFVFEDSSRKAKLVVSLYVVGFCFMYNIPQALEFRTPPFSSFGPSRDYAMDFCLEVYL